MKKKLIIMAMFILLMLAAIPAAMACSHPSASLEWQVSVKATCTTAGQEFYVCKACGTKLASRSIAKKGHSWRDWYDVEPATCQKKGTKAHTCRSCSAKETRTVDYNRANHVDWGEWEVKRKACDPAGGYKIRKCKCGQTERKDLEKKAHSWGNWYDLEPATCQNKGTKAHNCRNCGTKETRIVEYNRANHVDWGEWVVKRKACDPDGGYKERKCKCGQTETEKLEKKAHNWGIWYDVEPATCQAKGVQAHNCRTCATRETRIVEYNRANHVDWGDWVTKRAACHPDKGYKERKCKCGQKEIEYFAKEECKSFNKTPAYKDGIYVWNQTCTRCGSIKNSTPMTKREADRYVIVTQYTAEMKLKYPDADEKELEEFGNLLFDNDKCTTEDDQEGKNLDKFVNEHSKDDKEKQTWQEREIEYMPYKTGPYIDEDGEQTGLDLASNY